MCFWRGELHAPYLRVASFRDEVGHAQSELLEWCGKRHLWFLWRFWIRLLSVSTEASAVGKKAIMCHTGSGFPAFSAMLLSVISPMVSAAPVVLFGASRVTSGSVMAFRKVRG